MINYLFVVQTLSDQRCYSVAVEVVAWGFRLGEVGSGYQLEQSVKLVGGGGVA